MNIAIVLTPPNDLNFRLASQASATDFVARNYDLHTTADVRAVQERAAAFGMRVSVIEGALPIDPIVHAKPERDEKIAEIGRLIVMMGECGIPVLCYNFMPYMDWTRTNLRDARRAAARSAPASISKSFGMPIPEIHPEASKRNDCGRTSRISSSASCRSPKRPAYNSLMHPDDPPLPRPRRSRPDHAYLSPECFERLFEIEPSPNNGMCFCQGTFSEMGVDIPATIRRLGERIRYVHFRDVVEAGFPRGLLRAFTITGEIQYVRGDAGLPRGRLRGRDAPRPRAGAGR